ncbi:MAG TPA: CocE/NonD family hydrolase [Vicinamibacterales bacterium]|nr:CocE/NonD family hydrolase [Vicinamibacterales bacterium]
MRRLGWVAIAVALCAAVPLAAHQQPQQQQQTLPSEIPQTFTPVTTSFDYERRVVMIPMRDGVKLHTVILVPKGASRAPMLLTRTPYDADALTTHEHSTHLEPILQGYDNAADVIVDGGYIRVVQDIRGKYHSEGDFVMNRPLHGPLNPTDVDESTDTYDTIDWLVKHVSESNGKVGILGISYDGFLPLMALVHPHPALAVAVPMNPMVDGWRGDDWFHNGAFREEMMSYIYEQEASRSNDIHWPIAFEDDYDLFMQAGSAGALAQARGLDQVGFWRKLVAHPSYDAFWQEQAMDTILAHEPLKVPTMIVAGLWDQEDIYGAMAVYRAVEPKDTGNDLLYLAIGPWYHGQEINEGSSLGAVRFGSDTALWFRQHVLAPFLAHYLKDGAPPMDVSPVTAFETGTNEWERLKAWPQAQTRKLYLEPGLQVGFTAPASGGGAYDEYVSDPSKPVPYRPRPSRYPDPGWHTWLTGDQREVSGRPDVLAFASDTLKEPLAISGQPMVNLVASTTGTDGDWVVKLIDEYPPEVAAQPEMGGYQLMVAADIFRGRYRESLETPKAIVPNEPLVYRFALPTANHVFLPGHRIMVQVQSSWFPLYDRNPQTFVPSIFFAKPGDYRKATIRIYHAPGRESAIELPVLAAPATSGR